MKLEAIIQDMGAVEVTGSLAVEPGGISFDSRKVAEGDLFVAIRGSGFDGHKYIPDAIASGAVPITVIEIKDNKLKAYAKAAGLKSKDIPGCIIKKTSGVAIR